MSKSICVEVSAHIGRSGVISLELGNIFKFCPWGLGPYLDPWRHLDARSSCEQYELFNDCCVPW